MAALSKLDYLKRYMDDDGGNNEKKKLKKKRKFKNKHNNIRIIDDAITFKDLDNNINSEDEGEFDLQEEKPIQYAEDGTTMITAEYEENERLKKSRWNPLASNETNDNIENNKISTKDLQRQKSLSPPRKSQRHDSGDNDMSPVRQSRVCLSPPRKSQRHDSSDSDLSPVRQSRVRRSPPRKLQRHDSSDSDMSPVRQNRVRHDTSDSDASPVRRSNSKLKNSDQDLSPVRRKRYDSDDDLSSKRGVKNSHRNPNISKDNNTESKRKELLPEVLSTGKTGLSTGAELRKENEFKRQHQLDHMKSMDADASGKGAETVYRDRKSGKQINTKLDAITKRKLEEERLEHQEKYAKWGKGVAQGDSYKEKLKDDLREIAKPLARYKDDKDLDVLLKEQDRDGDPMLAYMNKQKTKLQTTAGKPRYKGQNPPPNRFNIWPGYRYDGVDRSNGFEKRRFMEINKRKTVRDAAYKWSVEEM